MKAEHVNAFLVPSVQVIMKMAQVEVRAGKVARAQGCRMDDNVSIVIGLQGRLSGSVILTADKGVARELALRTIRDARTGLPEDEVRSVFAEMANTIVGNATGRLYELGVREGITPPTVITGPEVRVGFEEGTESVVIPLETEVGHVDMIVSLSEGIP